MPRFRDGLPQLADQVLLTDGGIETTLIFRLGRELPHFAAFVLLEEDEGRAQLLDYFATYAEIAAAADAGLVLEAPTWRASSDWGRRLGYGADDLARVNRAAIDLMLAVRSEFETAVGPIVISGCVGPQGDAYTAEDAPGKDEARDYHAAQVRTFSETEADMVTALTLTTTEEAIGLTKAAQDSGIPAAISFTVETDGQLPSGIPLGDAVQAVDEATGYGPAYYMVNCAHPTHFAGALLEGCGWPDRIRGIRANASTRSHAELDEAEELDAGDPEDLGARYAALREQMPHLTVLGGCCGTDERHLTSIRDACLGRR